VTCRSCNHALGAVNESDTRAHHVATYLLHHRNLLTELLTTQDPQAVALAA
jgi:hypothetical protein